jgi:hypothetical protein
MPPIDNYFLLVISAQSPQNRPRDMMGMSYRAGIYPHAYVLYSRVKEFIRDHAFPGAGQSETGAVLGHIIAHELGHLLMPGEPHSITGIMRADWGGREVLAAIQGTLLFHPGQVKLIQKRLQRQ